MVRGGWACRNCGEMKPRKDYHKNHSKADELEDVCKPCKAVRDAARRRSRATVRSSRLDLIHPDLPSCTVLQHMSCSREALHYLMGLT